MRETWEYSRSISNEIRMASRHAILENECLLPITRKELLTYDGPITLLFVDPMKIHQSSKGLRWFRTSHPREKGCLGFKHGFAGQTFELDEKNLPLCEVLIDCQRFWVNFTIMRPLLIQRLENFVDDNLAKNYVETILYNTFESLIPPGNPFETGGCLMGTVVLFMILHYPTNESGKSSTIFDIFTPGEIATNLPNLPDRIAQQFSGEKIPGCEWISPGYLDVYDTTENVSVVMEDIVKSMLDYRG
ncbi:Hypothetical protein POVR1_LOCUS273 [uncultured virus]|nr:Hypothetical protein POVR1_LOCUS273 [uncultured virus]